MEEYRYSSLSLSSFIVESNGISKKAQDILEASWRPSARERYAGHLQQFTQYCHQRNVDPFQTTTKIGIEHLTNYFHTGVGYSSVNTVRPVLSTIIKTEIEITFGELPLVCRFLKGVFNLRPALPRYFTTWDVSVVLKYIKSLKALKQCDLKSLSYQLAILLCITTGQRDQTLFYMNIDLMMFEADKVTIFVPELLKQSRPGHHLDPMVLLRYPDQEIFVVSHLEQYIEKTKNLLKDQNLLISFVKPHKRITTSTILTVLKNVGVNITMFGSHLTRSASIAHCKKTGLSLKEIEKAARWSSFKTFVKHYNKPIVDESGSFSGTVLES